MIKNDIKQKIESSNLGRELLFHYKKITNKIPEPDLEFPELISLEIASSCNLSCIHCPPHLKEFKDEVRKFGIMDVELFYKMMDEIDNYGRRRIALHKDGEPLLHPQISSILRRVKQNNNHIVYLTTNAHPLNENISKALLENKIDVLNFSIGAATEGFYSKVRGKNFNKVIDNILRFLELRKLSNWKPRVIVQIIDLPQFENMQNEISNFRKYWSKHDVEVQVWQELSWGLANKKSNKIKRYPCYSLWESVNINSDGKASACCMDWQQKLIAGNASNETIKEIWSGSKQQELRMLHINGKENDLPICPNCNYWSWQNKLSDYEII